MADFIERNYAEFAPFIADDTRSGVAEAAVPQTAGQPGDIEKVEDSDVQAYVEAVQQGQPELGASGGNQGPPPGAPPPPAAIEADPDVRDVQEQLDEAERQGQMNRMAVEEARPSPREQLWQALDRTYETARRAEYVAEVSEGIVRVVATSAEETRAAFMDNPRAMAQVAQILRRQPAGAEAYTTQLASIAAIGVGLAASEQLNLPNGARAVAAALTYEVASDKPSRMAAKGLESALSASLVGRSRAELGPWSELLLNQLPSQVNTRDPGQNLYVQRMDDGGRKPVSLKDALKREPVFNPAPVAPAAWRTTISNAYNAIQADLPSEAERDRQSVDRQKMGAEAVRRGPSEWHVQQEANRMQQKHADIAMSRECLASLSASNANLYAQRTAEKQQHWDDRRSSEAAREATSQSRREAAGTAASTRSAAFNNDRWEQGTLQERVRKEQQAAQRAAHAAPRASSTLHARPEAPHAAVQVRGGQAGPAPQLDVRQAGTREAAEMVNPLVQQVANVVEVRVDGSTSTATQVVSAAVSSRTVHQRVDQQAPQSRPPRLVPSRPQPNSAAHITGMSDLLRRESEDHIRGGLAQPIRYIDGPRPAEGGGALRGISVVPDGPVVFIPSAASSAWTPPPRAGGTSHRPSDNGASLGPQTSEGRDSAVARQQDRWERVATQGADAGVSSKPGRGMDR